MYVYIDNIYISHIVISVLLISYNVENRAKIISKQIAKAYSNFLQIGKPSDNLIYFRLAKQLRNFCRHCCTVRRWWRCHNCRQRVPSATTPPPREDGRYKYAVACDLMPRPLLPLCDCLLCSTLA